MFEIHVRIIKILIFEKFLLQVAIKIFDLQRMTDKYMTQHLRREAVILAKLSHPNVVALYEVHEVSLNNVYLKNI